MHEGRALVSSSGCLSTCFRLDWANRGSWMLNELDFFWLHSFLAVLTEYLSNPLKLFYISATWAAHRIVSNLKCLKNTHLESCVSKIHFSQKHNNGPTSSLNPWKLQLREQTFHRPLLREGINVSAGTHTEAQSGWGAAQRDLCASCWCETQGKVSEVCQPCKHKHGSRYLQRLQRKLSLLRVREMTLFDS